jgi:hypothetical protein
MKMCDGFLLFLMRRIPELPSGFAFPLNTGLSFTGGYSRPLSADWPADLCLSP